MKTFGASIPIGIGDLIYIKAIFEPIKTQYSHIFLKFHRELITRFNRDPGYNQFLDQLGSLLFGTAPYVLTAPNLPYCSLQDMVNAHGLYPHKPELSNILCMGTPLQIDEPYIVFNTKVRSLPRALLESKIREFWYHFAKLSEKYKIVILGEKVVEMNQEYQIYTSEHIYSLYPHIMNNISHDRIIDLTVPSLGITTPNLSQIKQDCLIMNQAKFVVNFGIGGGFCMATAVSNIIGYRYDDDFIADIVFENPYPNALVTKDWGIFIKTLQGYL